MPLFAQGSRAIGERSNDEAADDEPVYPGTCRERSDAAEFKEPAGVNWRFRVPDGEAIEFTDLNLGRQRYVAGKNVANMISAIF